MTSVMLVMTIAQARIFLAMAQDGLLPQFFGRVHPQFRTPSSGPWSPLTVPRSSAACSRSASWASWSSIGTLLGIRHGVHRRAGPALDASGPAAPLQGAVAVVHLHRRRPHLLPMMMSPCPATWYGCSVWTLIGVLIYAFYGYHHSKVQAENSAAGAASPAPSR